MRSPARYIALSVLVVAAACESTKELQTGQGYVDVNGGKIWYKVEGRGEGTPLLLLHGGPGSTSYYLNPLLALGAERPVITFDQLGCGRSDRIQDTTLMTVENYVDQVKMLLNHLEVRDFYLYGHSWGTMLATDYYLKYPEGIKAMILASPCLSAGMWVSDADTLIASLPDSTEAVLRNDIARVPQDSAVLQKAIQSYFDNFYARKYPLSADLDSVNMHTGVNVYHYMWGTSEFAATGILKNYDRTGDLKRIGVPTLYTTGEFDAARPVTVKHYQNLTPNSSFKLIPGAGHLTMQDNAPAEIEAISGFLKTLEH